MDTRRTTATNNANIRAQIEQANEQARLAREQWEWQKKQAEKAAAATGGSNTTAYAGAKPALSGKSGTGASASSTGAWGGSKPTDADAKSRYGQGYRGTTPQNGAKYAYSLYGPYYTSPKTRGKEGGGFGGGGGGGW